MQLTDNSLIHLSQGPSCRELKRLYVSFTRVSDVGVRAVANSPMAASLQSVHLQGAFMINNASVLYLVSQCSNLTLLDVSGCSSLTDELVDGLMVALHTTHNTTLIATPPTTRRTTQYSEHNDERLRLRIRRKEDTTEKKEGKENKQEERRNLTLCVSACYNISAQARSHIKQCGVLVCDDVEFCGEIVEAEVALEVYDKLQLLAFHQGYATVAQFVRTYMHNFLQQHQLQGEGEQEGANGGDEDED